MFCTEIFIFQKLTVRLLNIDIFVFWYLNEYDYL